MGIINRRLVIFIVAITQIFSSTIALAQGFSPFEVEDVRIIGLHRFDPGVIFNRINIETGEKFSSEDAILLIKKIHKSGYFTSVEVLRDDNILVIRVKEKPTIAEVSFAGVEELNSDNLREMLNRGGVSKALVLNRSSVNAAARAIEQAYNERNYPQAKVESIISPLERNRVAVLFKVDEGKQTTIRSIDIRGNNNKSDWSIKRNIEIAEKSLLNYFFDSHEYSEVRLRADVERIRSFYLEDGYLRFAVTDVKTEKSEDGLYIDIVIEVNEGKQYVVSEYTLGSELPKGVNDFDSIEQQLAGEIFNSQEAEHTSKALRDHLGDLGYANARVGYDTDIDNEAGTVRTIFRVDTDTVVHVRRINIVGNEKTSDLVIRREFLQHEYERYSQEKVEKSRGRLRRLGYFTDVQIHIVPVPDNPKEVDLMVTVIENSAGNVNLGAGFSSSGEGVTLEGSLNNPNVFGSGNDFIISGKYSKDAKSLNFNLDELYYTDEGVSRHLAVDYNQDESATDATSYSTDGYGGEFGYGFPFTDEAKYYIYAAYKKILINQATTLDPSYQPFIQKHGEEIDISYFKLILLHDSLNTSIAPTKGQRISINGEASTPFLDLRYFLVDYQHDYYYTLRGLPSKPVWHIRGGAAFGDSYGSDVFPFYNGFYLGGPNTLRGFKSNSIGYANNSSNTSLSGQSRLYSQIELAFNPKLFSAQQIFLVPFIDAGIVGKDIFGGWGGIRASGGLEIRWVSPIGPLRFSYVKPIYYKTDDNLQDFQFSIGTF